MPRRCCVPGCKSNNSNINLVSTFSFPHDEERKRLWLKCIRKDNYVLSKSSGVCIKHFPPEFILTEEEIRFDDGRVYIQKLSRPRLTKDSYPTIFPNHPRYLSSTPSISTLLADENAVDSNLEQTTKERLEMLPETNPKGNKRKKKSNKNSFCKKMKFKFMKPSTNTADFDSSVMDFQPNATDTELDGMDFESIKTDEESKTTDFGEQPNILNGNDPLCDDRVPNLHLKTPKNQRTTTKTFVHAYKEKWDEKQFQIEIENNIAALKRKETGRTGSKIIIQRPRPKRTRNCDKVFDSELLMLPLIEGWKREVVVRAAKRDRRDTYYYSPCGAKLRSSKELEKFLIEKGYLFTKKHFTFAQTLLGFGEPYEVERTAKLYVNSPIKSTLKSKKSKKKSPTKSELVTSFDVKEESPVSQSVEKSGDAVPDETEPKNVVYMEELSDEDTLSAHSFSCTEEGNGRSETPKRDFNNLFPSSDESFPEVQNNSEEEEENGGDFLPFDELLDEESVKSVPEVTGEKPQLPVFQLRIEDDSFEEEEDEVGREIPNSSFLDYTSAVLDKGDGESPQMNSRMGESERPSPSTSSTQTQAKIRVRSLDELCGAGGASESCDISNTPTNNVDLSLLRNSLLNKKTALNGSMNGAETYKVNVHHSDVGFGPPTFVSLPSTTSVTSSKHVTSSPHLPTTSPQCTLINPVYNLIHEFPNRNSTPAINGHAKPPITSLIPNGQFRFRNSKLPEILPTYSVSNKYSPSPPVLSTIPPPQPVRTPPQTPAVIKVVSKQRHFKANQSVLHQPNQSSPQQKVTVSSSQAIPPYKNLVTASPRDRHHKLTTDLHTKNLSSHKATVPYTLTSNVTTVSAPGPNSSVSALWRQYLRKYSNPTVPGVVQKDKDPRLGQLNRLRVLAPRPSFLIKEVPESVPRSATPHCEDDPGIDIKDEPLDFEIPSSGKHTGLNSVKSATRTEEPLYNSTASARKFFGAHVASSNASVVVFEMAKLKEFEGFRSKSIYGFVEILNETSGKLLGIRLENSDPKAEAPKFIYYPAEGSVHFGKRNYSTGPQFSISNFKLKYTVL